MLVVVITGPPGAGKSVVATAVHDRLCDLGVANALIEADELRRSHPPLPPQRVLRHVALLLRSYVELGHELLFVTETLETDDDTAALRAALGHADTVIVRLDADAETVAARIRDREPPSWSGLEALVRHARHLATQMRSLAGVDLVVRNDGRDVEAAAEEILELLRDCGATPSAAR